MQCSSNSGAGDSGSCITKETYSGDHAFFGQHTSQYYDSASTCYDYLFLRFPKYGLDGWHHSTAMWPCGLHTPGAMRTPGCSVFTPRGACGVPRGPCGVTYPSWVRSRRRASVTHPSWKGGGGGAFHPRPLSNRTNTFLSSGNVFARKNRNIFGENPVSLYWGQ